MQDFTYILNIIAIEHTIIFRLVTEVLDSLWQKIRMKTHLKMVLKVDLKNIYLLAFLLRFSDTSWQRKLTSYILYGHAHKHI